MEFQKTLRKNAAGPIMNGLSIKLNEGMKKKTINIRPAVKVRKILLPAIINDAAHCAT